MTALAELAVPSPVDHAKHPCFAIQVEVVCASKGQAVLQLRALVPELELAGGIAKVRSDLEHRHDDDLHLIAPFSRADSTQPTHRHTISAATTEKQTKETLKPATNCPPRGRFLDRREQSALGWRRT